jgi:hypothetical protein
MKREMLLIVVVTLMLTNSGPLAACGDKFLGAGRGPRFARVYAAVYPGRLLVYAPGKGELATLQDKGLDKELRRAGHQVIVVKDLASLSRTLQDRPVDIVLADNQHMTEAGTVAGEIAVKPSVLPVSKSTINFLKTLDDTMKLRLTPRPFSGGK